MAEQEHFLDDLELTVWWWGTLSPLSVSLKQEILKEYIPRCNNEDSRNYLKGAQALLGEQVMSLDLSDRFISDFETLWRARPYFVICFFLAIIYMLVKGGITLGRFIK